MNHYHIICTSYRYDLVLIICNTSRRVPHGLGALEGPVEVPGLLPVGRVLAHHVQVNTRVQVGTLNTVCGNNDSNTKRPISNVLSRNVSCKETSHHLILILLKTSTNCLCIL